MRHQLLARNWLAGLFVVGLTVPIQIADFGTGQVALADAMAGLSLLFLVAVVKAPEFWLMGVAFFLSVLAMLWIAATVTPDPDLRPIASIAYFFKPYLLFAAGFALIDNASAFTRIWKSVAALATATACLIVLPIIISGGQIRIEGQEGATLQGTLLGLPVFGLSGVNAIVVFYATLVAILTVAVVLPGRPIAARVWYLIGIALFMYVILGAASRQAMAGLVIFSVAFSYSMAGRHRKAVVAVVAIIAVVIGVMATAGRQWIVEQWSFKLDRDIGAITEGDWVAVSAGRLVLYMAELSDISRNPVFGVGFHGFQLHHDAIPPFPYVVGLSPHSQFLGALWKMGLVAGVFYLGFVLLVAARSYQVHRRFKTHAVFAGLWALTLAYLGGFAILQDAFTYPLTGAIMMFLLGGAARIHHASHRQDQNRTIE